MSAGAMDRLIVIERDQGSADSFGQKTPNWQELATVWAKRTPIADGERWRGGEIAAQITHRFLIYWSGDVSGVTPKDRIVSEGMTYDIAGVKERGLREFIEITASARIDG